MSTDDDSDARTTRITRKGQVTIPKALREEFGLEEGDQLRWEVDEAGITVRKATQSAGRGMLVDEATSDQKREAMATELAEEIREKRRNDWEPK